MKRIFFIVSLVLLACTASLPLSAKVRLPRLVSDRMVLQRDTELKIWGWASPGEKVTVRFRGKHYNTEADAKGNWLVLLPPQQAGGPFLLEVNDLLFVTFWWGMFGFVPASPIRKLLLHV